MFIIFFGQDKNWKREITLNSEWTILAIYISPLCKEDSVTFRETVTWTKYWTTTKTHVPYLEVFSHLGPWHFFPVCHKLTNTFFILLTLEQKTLLFCDWLADRNDRGRKWEMVQDPGIPGCLTKRLAIWKFLKCFAPGVPLKKRASANHWQTMSSQNTH